MADLLLQLAPAGDPDEGGITGDPLHGGRGHAAAALELAGGGARRAGQGVEAGPDDQLRAGPARALGLATPAAELDQRIGAALFRAAIVVLDGSGHQGVQRAAHRRSTFGIEDTIDPHQAVPWIAQVQIASLMRAVGLREREGGVDPVLEAFA